MEKTVHIWASSDKVVCIWMATLLATGNLDSFLDHGLEYEKAPQKRGRAPFKKREQVRLGVDGATYISGQGQFMGHLHCYEPSCWCNSNNIGFDLLTIHMVEGMLMFRNQEVMENKAFSKAVDLLGREPVTRCRKSGIFRRR